MTKLFKGLAVIVFAAFSSVAAAEAKIAVIDVQAAMQATEHFKTMAKNLEASQNMKSFQAELKTIDGDLKAMEERQKKDGSTWSQEEAQQFQQQAQHKLQQRENVVRNIQGNLQREMGKLSQQLAPHAQQALKDIVTAQAIDILLAKNAVIHAAPTFDITAQLTSKLNAVKLAN